MRVFLYSCVLYLAISLTGCQSQDSFEGFDSEAWKSDRSGCKGKRQSMKDDLENIRQKLKGLSYIEILDVLGRPDVSRPDERNMTSYLYFMQPSGKCKTGGRTDAQVVIVRFNAVGLAFEVIYDKGLPL